MDETLKNEWISFYQHIVKEGKKKGQFDEQIDDIDKLFNDDDEVLVSQIANSFLRMDDVTDERLEMFSSDSLSLWCESYREWDINEDSDDEDSDDLEPEIHYQLDYSLCTVNKIWRVTIDTFTGGCIYCHSSSEILFPNTPDTDFKFIEESKEILSKLQRTFSLLNSSKK